MWLPPGGHVDRGFTFSETVNIEMKEELGAELQLIQASPFFLTRTFTRGLSPKHVDVTAWYLLEGSPLQQYSIYPKEASESRWMDIEDLINFPEESHVPRAARKLLTLFQGAPFVNTVSG